MVKPTDWDSVEADEAEAIRRHARADFRMNEMKKELARLEAIEEELCDVLFQDLFDLL